MTRSAGNGQAAQEQQHAAWDPRRNTRTALLAAAEGVHAAAAGTRADCYRVLARLLAVPADADLLALLRTAAADGDTPLGHAWNDLCTAAGEEVRRVVTHYDALFTGANAKVNTNSNNNIATMHLYASWHRRGSLPHACLVHLGDSRAEPGRSDLVNTERTHEPEDRITALMETMCVLVSEGASCEAVFATHLAPWYARFCDTVATQEESPFYRAVGRYLRSFLDSEHERLLGYLP